MKRILFLSLMIILVMALLTPSSQAACDISEIPDDFQFTQDLQKGSQGTEVKYLQLVLQCIVGEDVVGPADGIFGTKTETAVKQYQSMRGLVVDGIVGPNTRAALNKDLAELREPNQPPTCSISANPRSGPAPLKVTFSMSASDSDGWIAAWVLDVNGDGKADYSGEGEPPSTLVHTYTSPSPPSGYTVILMVGDNDGASAFDIETVIVGENDPPTCSLSANPNSGPAPLKVTFSMSASDSDGWISAWALDVDGNGSTDYSGEGVPPPTLVHTYTNPNIYLAILGVSDDKDATTFDTETITVTSEPTRIIRLEGNLNFGDVKVGSSSQRTLTIYNDGTATLNVSSISYPTGFSGNWSGGDISAGSHKDVTVTFSPTQAIDYGGTITVFSDKTSGDNTISASGRGIPPECTLKVVPQKDPIAVGETTTIDVLIESASNLGGFEFRLYYNSNIIEINTDDAQMGSFLPPDKFYSLGPNIKDSKLVYGASLLGDVSGQTGSGSLARITIKGIGIGTTSLDLQDVLIIDASSDMNQPIVNIINSSITVTKPPNTSPTISGLPDKTLNEDSSLDNTIDLWAYASDAETPNSGLTFIITGNTNPDCGVSIDSNRYIDIYPTANWYGYSDVTVKVTDPEGLFDDDTFRITVNPVNDPPVILLTIPNQSADKNTPIIIDLTPYESDVEDSGTSLDWYVEGEDFCTVTGEYSNDDVLTFTPNHNFVGDDYVTLYLIDSEGLTDSQQIKLTWVEVYKAAFTWLPEKPLEGQEVQFTDQSTSQAGIVSWLWDFGDGETSTEQHPKYTYMQASNPSQTFSVILTVKWNDGDSDAETKSVEIYDKDPVAKFHWDPLEPEVGQEITFFDDSESYDGIASWNWDFGDGGTSPEKNPKHVYLQAGTYKVKLTVKEADEDTDTYSQDIVIACFFADVNCDNKVNVFDVLLVATAWGTCSGEPDYKDEYDLNEDECIDIEDLTMVAEYWGEEAPFEVKATPSSASLDTQKVTFKADSPYIRVGDVARFDVISQGDNQVQAFELQLSYDADILEFKKAQLGEIFSLQKDKSTVIALGPKFDKSKGKFLYGGICLSDNSHTYASGTIAHLEFMPKQVGELQLDMSYLKLVDSQWQLLPVAIKKQIPQKILPQPPKKSALLQNYPNPFNPDTWIPYQLSKDADVTISIYNIKGQLIRQIYLGHKQAGYYLDKSEAAYWDGKNNAGEKAASGMYFYQLQTGDFRAMRRMVILK